MISHDSVADAPSAIAAAIGEPARARILYSLLDGRARTSTELALVADVTPSTASTHLKRLKGDGLVDVVAQGKHRYYRLQNGEVASVLEALSVLAGRSSEAFVSRAPAALRSARTCYDHIAGALGVTLHDRLVAMQWIRPSSARDQPSYDLSSAGAASLSAFGIDVLQLRASRRRLAFGCLDWSERRPHLGGALGAALLRLALERKWVIRERDGRALHLTTLGQRDLVGGLERAGILQQRRAG